MTAPDYPPMPAPAHPPMSQDQLRQEAFDQAIEMYMSLESAVEAAGANRALINNYMDRPLAEFLAQVCAPNGIRFQHKSAQIGEWEDDAKEKQPSIPWPR